MACHLVVKLCNHQIQVISTANGEWRRHELTAFLSTPMILSVETGLDHIFKLADELRGKFSLRSQAGAYQCTFRKQDSKYIMICDRTNKQFTEGDE